VVDSVRTLYLAGMATMRLCAMAEEIIPGQDLTLVVGKLLAGLDRNEDFPEKTQQECISRYWVGLYPSLTLSKEYDQLCAQVHNLDEANFDKLCAHLRALASSNLLVFVIDYAEGRWHLHHSRNELAEQCLQKVVAAAEGRQLGEIAAEAASILIALRLTGLGPLKFEALNRLLRVRIDNMPQSIEMCIDYIPTPFSDWSPRPKPSFYDSHLMQSVAFLNKISCAPGVSAICNPLEHFDASLENLIAKSRRVGARLTDVEQKRPAIVGTSIKTYQVLRDHLYYRNALFGLNPSNLPGMDVYTTLPRPDQLRLLRFVDPEQFQHDLQAHGFGPRRHTDDVS